MTTINAPKVRGGQNRSYRSSKGDEEEEEGSFCASHRTALPASKRRQNCTARRRDAQRTSAVALSHNAVAPSLNQRGNYEIRKAKEREQKKNRKEPSVRRQVHCVRGRALLLLATPCVVNCLYLWFCASQLMTRSRREDRSSPRSSKCFVRAIKRRP